VYTTLRQHGVLIAFLSVTNCILKCDQVHS